MGEEQGISIRARFDHAPTSLKGALILRGEDANPHQVVLSDVRLVAVDGTWDAGRALRLPGSTVDVAPRRDVFVPFEVGVAFYLSRRVLHPRDEPLQRGRFHPLEGERLGPPLERELRGVVRSVEREPHETGDAADIDDAAPGVAQEGQASALASDDRIRKIYLGVA